MKFAAITLVLALTAPCHAQPICLNLLDGAQVEVKTEAAPLVIFTEPVATIDTPAPAIRAIEDAAPLRAQPLRRARGLLRGRLGCGR